MDADICQHRVDHVLGILLHGGHRALRQRPGTHAAAPCGGPALTHHGTPPPSHTHAHDDTWHDDDTWQEHYFSDMWNVMDWLNFLLFFLTFIQIQTVVSLTEGKDTFCSESYLCSQVG